MFDPRIEQEIETAERHLEMIDFCSEFHTPDTLRKLIEINTILERIKREYNESL